MVNQLINRKWGILMLNLIFLAIERLAIAFIVGGGVIMAICVRPLLLQHLSRREHPELVSNVEGISIGAWNRYNRFALISTVILVVLGFIRILLRIQFSYWETGLSLVMFVLLLRKIAIDRKLKARLHEIGDAAVGSEQQKAGHRQVELLSKVILVVAVVSIVLPE